MAIFALFAVLLDCWPIAVLGPLSIILPYAAVLALEFGLLWRSYAPADPERPRAAQLATAWVRETTFAPRVFLWRQPFRARVQRDHLPIAAAGQRGVLFVHGFFCNRGIWNPWMRRLSERHVPFVALDLEPVFGSIDSYVNQIALAIERLEQATQMAPVIVAHSMGGLASRAWLSSVGTNAARVHRLVTIATPHGGTRTAARGTAANVRQMRIGSEWGRALAKRESAETRARVVCFWSHCDNIVVPARGATLDGADNRHLVAMPHVAMVEHPAIFEAVLEMLVSDASPEAAT